MTIEDSEISFQSLKNFNSLHAERSALTFESIFYSYRKLFKRRK
jgi:hypothetical protein